jgi:hypothetical protein
VVEELRKKLPKLLRDDAEVRGHFIAVMSEYFTTREETQAILTELRQLSQRIEEQGRRIEEQGRRIDEHTRTLGAIGARWGMMAEDSFRAAVRSLFADQPDVTVEHWRHRDEAGTVFGYPADVDMDVVIRNGRLVVLEIKSSISAADVLVFARRVKLYEAVTGRVPDRAIMVGPWIDERAWEVGGKLGVELVTGVSPPVV